MRWDQGGGGRSGEVSDRLKRPGRRRGTLSWILLDSSAVSRYTLISVGTVQLTSTATRYLFSRVAIYLAITLQNASVHTLPRHHNISLHRYGSHSRAGRCASPSPGCMPLMMLQLPSDTYFQRHGDSVCCLWKHDLDSSFCLQGPVHQDLQTFQVFAVRPLQLRIDSSSCPRPHQQWQRLKRMRLCIPSPLLVGLRIIKPRAPLRTGLDTRLRDIKRHLPILTENRSHQ